MCITQSHHFSVKMSIENQNSTGEGTVNSNTNGRDIIVPWQYAYRYFLKNIASSY